METKQKERIRRLTESLKRTDKIHLKDAARMLEVSEMTIRRDLSPEHIEDVPLALLGGYIVSVAKPSSSLTPLVTNKTQSANEEEMQVATLAAGLVGDSDVIFFDNGPEMLLVISLIPDDIAFTGICYSHRVFLALNQKENATAILSGGAYRAKSDSFYDNYGQSVLDSVNPKMAFISASGIHEHYGVTWFNLDDLPIKRKAMSRSIRKVLLAKSSLFDEVESASIAPLSSFDMIISDKALPDEYSTYCKNGFVKVITPTD